MKFINDIIIAALHSKKKNLSENVRYKKSAHIPIVVGTDGLIFNSKIIK